MTILNRSLIDNFVNKHADAKQPLLAWFYEVKNAHWTCFQDIKASYSSADYVHKNKIVFNIKGNTYRLVVKVAFNSGTVFILRIGTHAEYNKWNIKEL